MIRLFALLSVILGLAACGNRQVEENLPVEPLGNFKMGHLAVVAPAPEKLLISREATPEEWINVVDAAFEDHFRKFEGDKFYHLGLSVEAYSLPPPIVPGKSAVAMRLTVWEDATQSKLSEETKVIQVIKVFESRISSSREQTMENLARDAAIEVEKYLREQMVNEGWFGGPEASAALTAAQAEAEALDQVENGLEIGTQTGTSAPAL